jgi:hypothetical protein
LLLMLMVECGRDTNLIYQIFLPSDAHDIVSISLPLRESHDILFWPSEKNWQ